MKKMTAKFTSKCSETNLTLKKGTEIYYDTYSRKAYHPTAKKVQDYNESESVKSYINAQEDAYFDRYTGGYYNY